MAFLIGEDIEVRGKKCKYCGKENGYVVGCTTMVCHYCGNIIHIQSLINKRVIMKEDKYGYVYLKELD